MFPSEELSFLPTVEKDICFSSGNKISCSIFSMPGITIPSQQEIIFFKIRFFSILVHCGTALPEAIAESSLVCSCNLLRWYLLKSELTDSMSELIPLTAGCA